jgi:plasmid maintenance system antidote protein VapI
MQQPAECDCGDRAQFLARVFGMSPDFWLNIQWRSGLWEAHSKYLAANRRPDD